MEIKLNKNYKVETIDELNYILYRKAEKKAHGFQLKDKDAEPGWKIIGYYSSLEILYEDLVDMDIKFSEAKTFKQLLEEVKLLKEGLRKIKS